MIWWRVVLGVVLFIGAGTFADYLCSSAGASFVVEGTDYARDLVERIFDALAGSLVLWGFLKNPRK